MPVRRDAFVLLLPAALVALGLLARAGAAVAFSAFAGYRTPFAIPPAPQRPLPALSERVVLVLMDGVGTEASRRMPAVSLGAYSVIALGASFAVVRWAKTAENATDYSVMNTGKQMLWLPTSREEKYKAKQAVDTFFVRTGDLFSAGIVFVGTTWLALGVPGFAFSNVILTVAWLAVAFLLLREHRRVVARAAKAEAA